MPTFLHVGCNQKRKDRTTQAFNSVEWNECRLDIDASVKPDIVASILAMTPVENESMDAVFSAHNIEHLYPHEVPVAIGEFWRVLKADGFVIITCPDIQEVCRLVAEGKLLEPVYKSPAGPIAPIDIIYGHRASIARGNQFMAHKCGFTLNVLIDVMRSAGFASTAGYRRGHPNYDLWGIATKQRVSDDHLKEMLDAHRPLR